MPNTHQYRNQNTSLTRTTNTNVKKCHKNTTDQTIPTKTRKGEIGGSGNRKNKNRQQNNTAEESQGNMAGLVHVNWAIYRHGLQ